MSSAQDLLKQAGEAESLGEVARKGVGGFFLAVASVFISGALTLGELFTKPISAMTDGVSLFIGSFFELPIRILEAAAFETARSLGAEWAVGPLTWVIGVASVLAGFLLLNWYIGLDLTGNVTGLIPFDVNWDIVPGIEGPEEESD